MVYLLHLDTPMSEGPDPRTGKERFARHYIGKAKNLDERLQEHISGQGARMLQVARQRGITWKLARTWEGYSDEERKLKARKNAPKLCPICRAKKDLSSGDLHVKNF